MGRIGWMMAVAVAVSMGVSVEAQAGCYSAWSPATQDDGKPTIVTHWPEVFFGGSACTDAAFGSGANSAVLSVYETHSELNFWGRARIKCLNESSLRYTSWTEGVEGEYVGASIACPNTDIDYAQSQAFYSYDSPDPCSFDYWLSSYNSCSD